MLYLSAPSTAAASTYVNIDTSGNAVFTNSKVKVLGSSTGAHTITSSNASASDYTLYIPASTTYIPASAQQLTFSGPTAARTFTLPDADSTLAPTSGKLSQFAATSSSELAGVISDETGSGALVFGTTPTLSNPTITNYVETVYAPAANSAFTVDLANGTFQKLTTNANVTITLPSSVSGKSYTIMVAYGGTHTVTWAGGSTIKWAGGSAPTATSTNGKFDIYVFACDGTNTYGADGGRNY